MTSATAAYAEAAAALGVVNLSSASPAAHTFASRFGDAGLDVTAMVCLDFVVVTAALGAALSAAGEAVA